MLLTDYNRIMIEGIRAQIIEFMKSSILLTLREGEIFLDVIRLNILKNYLFLIKIEINFFLKISILKVS